MARLQDVLLEDSDHPHPKSSGTSPLKPENGREKTCGMTSSSHSSAGDSTALERSSAVDAPPISLTWSVLSYAVWPALACSALATWLAGQGAGLGTRHSAAAAVCMVTMMLWATAALPEIATAMVFFASMALIEAVPRRLCSPALPPKHSGL